MNNQLEFELVVSNGYELLFKKPYQLSYIKKDDLYYCDDMFFGFFARTRNIEELKEQFMEKIIVDWQFYAICQESELSPGAILYRNDLLELLDKKK